VAFLIGFYNPLLDHKLEVIAANSVVSSQPMVSYEPKATGEKRKPQYYFRRKDDRAITGGMISRI